MRVYAIADLHLPGSTGKEMAVFGPHWRNHAERVAEDWDRRVSEADLVLLPGDFSWAMRLREAVADLRWVGDRPGTKLLIRGNHDFWWQGIKKVRSALPSGCYALQNDAWSTPDARVGVAGTRLWDVPGLDFGDIFAPPATALETQSDPLGARETRAGDGEQIFRRELGRLELSLQRLPRAAEHKLVMLHFPPTNRELEPTAVTALLEQYGVTQCVFGHLHAVRPEVAFSGARNGIRYTLVSADYTDFKLVEALSLAHDRTSSSG